jgi:cytochrome bd-type quinol oxidase subunit 1
VDAIAADRMQFAFTVLFHYLFPIATMGIVVSDSVIEQCSGAHHLR